MDVAVVQWIDEEAVRLRHDRGCQCGSADAAKQFGSNYWRATQMVEEALRLSHLFTIPAPATTIGGLYCAATVPIFAALF